MTQTEFIHVRNIITNKEVDIPPHWMDGPLGASYVRIGVSDFYKCEKVEKQEPLPKRSYMRRIKENDVE